MTFGPHQDLVLFALLVAIAALLVLAPVLRVPYPILLVLGGLALGFVPGIPTITLPPDVVLVAILPPLLYSAAFYTSLRDLRQNIIPISALAIGLVVATTVSVAAVAHMMIPGFGWGPAFVLGAVVSPTDPLAATAIARRLGVPRRIIAIVEGESLVNDGTALVLYRVAVVARRLRDVLDLGRRSALRLDGCRRGRCRPGNRLLDRRDPAPARQPAGRGDDRPSLRATSPICPPLRSASRACSLS